MPTSRSQTSPKGSTPTPDSAQFRGVVLIADDDDPFRAAQVALLRKHKYECLEARTSAEALATLNSRPVDILLSDIYMPGNEHLEMIEAVSSRFKGLPIVLFTGLPCVNTASRSIQYSVVGYLVKPPPIKEMLELIESAVARSKRRQVLAETRTQLEGWLKDLTRLEEELDLSHPSESDQLSADFLKLSLYNITRQLAGVAKASVTAKTAGDASGEMDKMALIKALEQTIETLEKTRQNFKSAELAALRRQITSVVRDYYEKLGARY